MYNTLRRGQMSSLTKAQLSRHANAQSRKDTDDELRNQELVGWRIRQMNRYVDSELLKSTLLKQGFVLTKCKKQVIRKIRRSTMYIPKAIKRGYVENRLEGYIIGKLSKKVLKLYKIDFV